MRKGLLAKGTKRGSEEGTWERDEGRGLRGMGRREGDCGERDEGRGLLVKG